MAKHGEDDQGGNMRGHGRGSQVTLSKCSTCQALLNGSRAFCRARTPIAHTSVSVFLICILHMEQLRRGVEDNLPQNERPPCRAGLRSGV